ncbi:MAG: Gfo/Idh/MocA family protein [Akkermansiaceae bacterium]
MTKSRRQFLKSSLAAGITPFISGGIAGAQIIGANNRLRLAVAGLNGRGKSHIDGFLGIKGVEIAYLIDPDKNVLAKRMGELRKKVEAKGLPFTTKGISDVREALDDKNLDALSIATPNHWHSLMTIWAAQAGKHVYVEKPMSHDIQEGRICVEAQQKYGIVIQHGTQRRSDAGIAGLSQAIRDGKFGRLKISYGYCCKPRNSIGMEKVSTPPDNLDWNLWRGPAEIDNYHGNYAHYDWHWFWKTGNGDMNNQGTHQLDVAAWALDADQTNPARVMAIGNRFQWNDQGETPNTMMGIAEYPNGQSVFFNVRNVNYKGYQRQVENEYYFEDGGKIVRNLYYPAGSKQGEKIDLPKGKVTPGGCWGSFATACREGKPEMANGNVLEAHYGCVLGHLMNNSYRLGEQAPFNAKAGSFGDNKDAAEHFTRLHDTMANGVKIPEDGSNYILGPWLTFDPKTEKHTGPHAAAANALLKDPQRKGFETPEPGKV